MRRRRGSPRAAEAVIAPRRGRLPNLPGGEAGFAAEVGAAGRDAALRGWKWGQLKLGMFMLGLRFGVFQVTGWFVLRSAIIRSG